MKVKQVEGVIVCSKCRGLGYEVQHDGSKHYCRLCFGSGVLIESDLLRCSEKESE